MEITGDKLRYVALFASVFALDFLDRLTSTEIKSINYFTNMKYNKESELHPLIIERTKPILRDIKLRNLLD